MRSSVFDNNDDCANKISPTTLLSHAKVPKPQPMLFYIKEGDVSISKINSRDENHSNTYHLQATIQKPTKIIRIFLLHCFVSYKSSLSCIKKNIQTTAPVRQSRANRFLTRRTNAHGTHIYVYAGYLFLF